jgi:hypothetical protein
MENENDYHALMACTIAKAIRQEARKIWELPMETDLAYTGKDWVTILLDKLDEDAKTKIIFIWWRAWHHRNNIIFDTGKASITHYVRFINNYFVSMQAIKGGTLNTDREGKGTMFVWKARSEEKTAPMAVHTWKRLEQGWTKINVDASFLINNQRGSWGAASRAHDGLVVFLAWGTSTYYQSAEMAEAIACLEGLKLVVRYT